MARIVELEGDERNERDQPPETAQQQRLRPEATVGERSRRHPETAEQQSVQQPETVRQQRVQQPETVRQQRVQQPRSVRQQSLQRPAAVGHVTVDLPRAVRKHRVQRPGTVQRFWLSVTVRQECAQLSTAQQILAEEARELRKKQVQKILWIAAFTGVLAMSCIGVIIRNITYEDPALDEIPNIVNRTSWQAKPPKSVKIINPPVRNVVISHTGTRECKTSDECKLVLLKLQDFHRHRGFYDIAYNFLVGGDGVVYEGRGWEVEYSPTHVARECSLGISFIGSFSEVQPLPNQILSARQLIRLGVREGHISENYKLIADRDKDAAINPGQELFNMIRNWPHWSPS